MAKLRSTWPRTVASAVVVAWGRSAGTDEAVTRRHTACGAEPPAAPARRARLGWHGRRFL